MEQAGLGTRERFRLTTTQAQLADVLGVTAVHLNRSLQALRAANVVRMEGFEIHAIAVQRLCAIAEFDPQYLLLDSGAK